MITLGEVAEVVAASSVSEENIDSVPLSVTLIKKLPDGVERATTVRATAVEMTQGVLRVIAEVKD